MPGSTARFSGSKEAGGDMVRAVATMNAARRRVKSLAGRLADREQAGQSAEEMAREERLWGRHRTNPNCQHGLIRETCCLCCPVEDERSRQTPACEWSLLRRPTGPRPGRPGHGPHTAALKLLAMWKDARGPPGLVAPGVFSCTCRSCHARQGD